MSNPGGNGDRPEREAFETLEGAVDQALDRLERMRERAASAEAKNAELTELLRRFTAQEVDPGEMVARLRRLEEENTDLRARIEQGREGVDRLLAKIRFLENQP